MFLKEIVRRLRHTAFAFSVITHTLFLKEIVRRLRHTAFAFSVITHTLFLKEIVQRLRHTAQKMAWGPFKIQLIANPESFAWLFCQHPRNTSTCFLESELLWVQTCCFALYQWKEEKGWPMMQQTLLPHMWTFACKVCTLSTRHKKWNIFPSTGQENNIAQHKR